MSSVQVSGLVTCAVVAVLGCGNDGTTVSELAAADTVAHCTAIKMVSPVNGAALPIDHPIALQAQPTCPGTGEVQFWVKQSGAANWTFLPGYFSSGQSSWTAPSEGTWNLTAVARVVGASNGYDVRAASVTIMVTASGAPRAVNDTLTTAMSTPGTVDLIANDQDPSGAGLVVTAVTQAAHGSVALAGALASYTPTPGFTGSDSFAYTISNATGYSSSATVAVTVAPVTPVCTIAIEGPDSAVVGAPIQLIAHASCNVGTPEIQWSYRSGNHAFAVFQPYAVATTVAFTSNTTAGTDQFYARVRSQGTAPAFQSNTIDVVVNDDVPPCTAVIVDAPIDGAFVAPGAAVTLHAIATCPAGVAAEFQFWVKQIGQAWTMLPGYVTGSMSFTPSALGGWAISATARSIGSHVPYQVRSDSVMITVTDSPKAIDDSLTIDEDQPGTVNVLANDYDPNGDALTAALVSGPSSGTATIAGGVVSYTPAHDYNGSDAITYVIDDGHGNTGTATLRITVNPVNDAPIAVDDALAVLEDNSGSVDVAINDSDVDGDALTVIAVDPPGHGTATFAGSVVSYLPAHDFNGQDAFAYTVSDGHGGTATATVVVTVTAVNDAPVAVDDDLTTAEDTPGAVYVLANDVDPDGEIPTVIAFDQPAHGSVTVVAGFASYVPVRDYNGQDAFSYTVQDSAGVTASATVHITVLAVNDPPVAVDDAASLEEDSHATIDVVGNDSDVDGEALAITSVTQPAHGTATISSGHEVTYTPAPDFQGTDAFTYAVADPSGATAIATVTLTVINVNDAPVAVGDSAALDEDTSATIDVVANDSDVDGDPLIITEITQPAHGSATIVDATHVRYTPAPDYHGPDAFNYTVADGNGGEASAQVALAVASVNDLPIAVDDSASLDEDGSATIDVVANDSDGDGDVLAVAAISQPAHGVAELVDPRHVIYTPAPDFNGADGFSYTIDDGNGGQATATVAITVRAVNDAPIARADAASVLEDGSVTIDVVANDSDVDGDPLAIAGLTQPGNGTVALLDGHRVLYTPAPNFHGPDGFSYTIADPSGLTAVAVVAIDVISVNDPPIAVADAADLDEDTAVTVDVVANDLDVEGDALAITAITQPSHGLALVVDAHHVRYIPSPNFHGSDALSYTISDGNGGQASAELALAVASVNDAPVAVADAASLDEDTSVTVDVIANDSDVDGDTLAIAAITQPAHGTATIVDARHVQYTPAPDYNGADSVSYTVDDGHGGQAIAALALTVNSVNDAPVAVADSAGLDEDTSATVDVVANDSDVDGDALTITSITQAAHGAAVIADAHHLLYTPVANYHGADTVDYTIDDGHGAHATARLTLTVISVNDAPIASSGTATTFDDTPVTVVMVASDVDGDPLSFSIASGPAHGTLSGFAGNQVVYKPAAGFAGPDAFTFTASDGKASASATISLTVVRSQCGNGVREGQEECDDGNATPGDGCEATCKLTCGSGTGADRATVDPVSGHCFAAYDGVHPTYQDAAALCAGFTGHLPTVTSASEDGAAFAAVAPGDRPWLGGDDLAVPGTFTWITGEPFVYTNYAGAPPTGCLQYTADGTWTAASCTGGHAAGALCEMEIASATPVFATGGNGTRSVVVADLNGDGFPDLAAVNQSSSSVGVLLGNGAGGFVLKATYPTGNGPIAIAAGDFDRDGRIDLAVVNATASTISLLRGTATGFSAAGTVAIAGGATSIVAGDFDGDGALDLAVGATATVQLLRGNGNGGFTVSASLTLTGAVAALATGDFDRDGKPDLAVTTPVAVLVVLSSGGGLLGTPITIAVSTGNRAITAADLDHDGNLDLAVVNGAANITVLFGSSTGAFSSPTTFVAPGAPQLIAAGDFDGDGAIDLAALTGSYATLFHASGRQFTAAGLSVATGGTGASFAAAASVNGDGAQDLVVANTGTGTAGLLLGGAGGFAGARELVSGTATSSTVAADFNEDGLPDLALVDPVAGAVTVFVQTASGALVQRATVTTNVNAGSTYAVVADFDGDHHLDLAISNASFSSVTIALGKGDGTFGPTSNLGVGQTPRRIAVADFNGDGKPDIAVTASAAGSISILINTGGGRFGRGSDIAVSGTPAAVVIGDFNNDGFKDLAVATTGEATVKLALGKGDGTFNEPTTFAIGSPSQSLAAADLDGDGALDLITANTSTGNVSILRGNNRGGFAAATSVAAGSQPAAVVAVDIDGDGRIDLVVGNAGSADITVLHNNGSGFAGSTLRLGVVPSWLTVVDLDHDGHPDIAASSGNPFVTTLFSAR